MHASIFYIANFIAAINAFTITSPTFGQTLNPTEPITFSWMFNSTDPAAFNVYLRQPGGLTSNAQVAADVSTFALSYIISASSVKSYGVNFTLVAESTTGDILATSPNFTLAMSSSSTYTGSVSEGPASATGAASASATATSNSTTTGTASAQSSASGMTSATGSNSFTTSTVSRSGSSTGTSASSAASATSSQNAQPKLGSRSQMAFTAAGLIAGLAALMA